MFDGTKTPQQRLDRIYRLLQNAKPIALTDEEDEGFRTMNQARNYAKLGWWITKVSERTQIPLSSGRVAYDGVGKRLLVVD